MVQRTIVTLEDDLDGGPARETVRFGLGGREYEIDLNGKNAKGLRKMVKAYAGSARKSGPVRGQPTRPLARRRQTAAVRAWALEQGHMFSERGRIPVWITDEYERVHGT